MTPLERVPTPEDGRPRRRSEALFYKRKLQIEPGMIVAVPVGGDEVVPGVVCDVRKNGVFWLAVYGLPFTTGGPAPETLPPDKLWVLAQTTDAKIYWGDWAILRKAGEIPEIELPRTVCAAPAPDGNGQALWLCNHWGDPIREATREEAETLPNPKMWSPAPIEKAARAFHTGKLEPDWVDKLRYTREGCPAPIDPVIMADRYQILDARRR